MKSLMMRLCLMGLATTAIAACSSGGGSEPQVAAEEAPAKVNPLTANRWCRAEDWDDFQVVMRLTLQGPEMMTEYLLLNPSGFTVYRYSQKLPWEMKGLHGVEPNKVQLSLHQMNADITALPGFDEQKRIFTEIFSKNPNLSHSGPDFTPPTALTTTTRTLSTGFEVERNVYPCDSFSSSFNGDGPVRPLMELIMLFSSNSKGFTEQGRGQLAAAMPFKYPLDEVQVQNSDVANTQWCSWRQVSSSELLMKSITFGNSSFIENIHSQVFENSFTDADLQDYLRQNAARSETFTMNLKGGRITAANTTPADRQPKHPAQELFAMMKDADGVRMLVRMDPREPDRSWPVFADIYYNCQDPRPLQFSQAFALRMNDILAWQVKQLQSPQSPVGTEPDPEHEDPEHDSGGGLWP